MKIAEFLKKAGRFLSEFLSESGETQEKERREYQSRLVVEALPPESHNIQAIGNGWYVFEMYTLLHTKDGKYAAVNDDKNRKFMARVSIDGYGYAAVESMVQLKDER